MVEFYYPEEIAAFMAARIRRGLQQAAYMKPVSNDEIGERMDAGRKGCWQNAATTSCGPYQSPMEDGMQHFHEWYRDAMGRAPSSLRQTLNSGKTLPKTGPRRSFL